MSIPAEISEQVIAAEAAASVAKKATSRKRKVADLMDPNEEKPKRAPKKQKVSIVNTINAKHVGSNVVTAGDRVVTVINPLDQAVRVELGCRFVPCKGQSVTNIPFVINGRHFTIIRRDIPDSDSSSDSSDSD